MRARLVLSLAAVAFLLCAAPLPKAKAQGGSRPTVAITTPSGPSVIWVGGAPQQVDVTVNDPDHKSAKVKLWFEI